MAGWLSGLGLRPAIRSEIEEEIAFHLDREAERLAATGVSRERARVEAAQRFGNRRVVAQACLRERWSWHSAAVALAATSCLVALLIVLLPVATPAIVGAVSPIHGGNGFPTVAPFTDVRWPDQQDDGRMEIEVGGRWYRWQGINEIAVPELAAFAGKTYSAKFVRKRLAEDLVEVMSLMGRPPGPSVDLAVTDLETGEASRLDSVPLTRANRRSVMASRYPERAGRIAALQQRLRGGPRWQRRSPFTGVSWHEDGRLLVEVEDRWWALLAIDGIAAADLEAGAKREFGDAWQKRIVEDVAEVVAAAGGRLGETCRLRLGDPATDEVQILDSVPATKAKRQRARARWAAQAGRQQASAPTRITREHAARPAREHARMARPWPAAGGASLSRARAIEDLDQLEAALVQRFAYFRWKGVDHEGALDAIRASLPERVNAAAFALRIQELVARFGDGHAGVRGFRSQMSGRFLPVLLADSSEGVVAFHEDRRRFADPLSPILVGIDGVPLEAWLEAAGRYVAHGSPQLRLRRSLRLLRQLDHFRDELGLPRLDTVRLQLRSSEGGPIRELNLPVSDRRPVYGPWPRENTSLLEGRFAYLRLFRMDGGDNIDPMLQRFRDTEGFIFDLRGNGGGRRDVIREFIPYLLPTGAASLAVNVGAYRLTPGEQRGSADGYLQNRYSYPATASVWSESEHATVRELLSEFEPEWQPPTADFSAWHVMLVSPDANPEAFHYARPVVVLLDGGCFSATDIFLSALERAPGVTLVGTPSSGGSARSQRLQLAHSGLELRLASMASFRPDGRMLDGRGVAPDVLVKPEPEDLLGRGDVQLEAALRLLRRQAAPGH